MSQHADGRWVITYACSLAHIHRERVDTVKGNARTLLAARRTAAAGDAAWCPRLEQERARSAHQTARERERARVLFADFCTDYLAWAKLHHKGYATDACRVALLSRTFGALRVDEITPAHIDAFLAKLLATKRPSTCNRYRTLLQAMLSRAVRHGLIATNPVKGIARHAGPAGRVVYLTPEAEGAVYRALRPEHRALFLVSLNTGFRWSEQRRLPWRCVDFLTNAITIEDSKSSRSRVVPMNSLVRALLAERATRRQRPGDPASWPSRMDRSAPMSSSPPPSRELERPSWRRARTPGRWRTTHGMRTATRGPAG